MARRNRNASRDESEPQVNTPNQEDEEDILNEAGAEPDGDSEGFVASEESIKKLGAVDAESARENRRLDNVAGKKKANMKGVAFNTDDPIVICDTLIRVWGSGGINIIVKRLTGSPVTHTITSEPRSGMELYEAIRTVHGQSPEAEYKVTFTGKGRGQYLGIGRITMPDTRPAQQQGQPMSHPFYQQPPFGVPQAQGPYSPQAQPVQPQPQQQPQPQFQMPPTMPPGTDINTLVQALGSLIGMVQSVQQPGVQPQAPQFAQQPGADVNSVKQIIEALRPFLNQGGQQQQPNPMVMAGLMPPMQPPAGTVWVPAMQMFVPISGIMQAVGGGQQHQGPGPRGPHRPPPHFERQHHHEPPPPPPSRHESPMDRLRETVSYVRTAQHIAEEIQNIFPGPGQQQRRGGERVVEEEQEPYEGGPRIVEVNGVKMVQDEDGSTRYWDSLGLNVPNIVKWAGEQVSKFHEAQKEQQQPQQRPRRRLQAPNRPGVLVEMREGDQPPEGWVAVPVHQEHVQESQPVVTHTPAPQHSFAPPPQHVPPPLGQASPPSDQGTGWGMPTIPGGMFSGGHQ